MALRSSSGMSFQWASSSWIRSRYCMVPPSGSLTPLRRRGGAEIDRQRQTGRAAVSLARDLVARVLDDLDAGVLESLLRDGVPGERESPPTRQREHVRPHRLELLVRNLDDLDLAVLEQLDERD